MARYLLEGDPAQARQQCEPTRSSTGTQDMKRFLKEWEERWKDISVDMESDKKSVVTNL